MQARPFDAQDRYVGIDDDAFGGMTPTGIMIRDARIFELITEDETCAGWTRARLQVLYDETTKAWEPYGHLVSKLPPPLRERHEHIHGAAVERARSMGWSPELLDES